MKPIERDIYFTLLLGIGAMGFVMELVKPPSRVPSRVYSRDVNNDKINDIVIFANGGSKYVFMGQKDGSYIRYEDFRISIEKQQKAELDSLEQIIKELK